MNIPKAQDPEEVRIEISDELRMEALRLFGLKPTDPRWDAILYAMLLTGCIEIRPTKQVTRTYYFAPVKVKKGAMSALGNETPRKMDEQRKFLYPFNKYI